MRKKFLQLVISIFVCSSVHAADFSKMNLLLIKELQNENNQSKIYSLLVKGNTSLIKEYVAAHSGTFKYNAGNISCISGNASLIFSLSDQSFVEKIEAGQKNIIPLNDTMRVKNNVEDVNNGVAPLPTAYSGNGVVMGYVDSGIDFTHPDFKDANGNTRIKYLWDQSKPNASNTPMPYNYGQEWNNADIDAGNAALDQSTFEYGHGTHVAGIGSGNGLANGRFRGVAPDCDIIMVAYDFTYSGNDPRIADAVDYIFNKANALGKPCVINASLGNYYGSHDALDLEAALIENLLVAQNGRIMITASGNIGGYPMHLQHQGSVADTNFTWLKYNSGFGACYTQLYGNVADFSQFTYSIGVDQVTPVYDFRGSTIFKPFIASLGVVKVDSIRNQSGQRIGIIQSLLTSYATGVYQMEFFIIPDSTTYNWRITTTGNGKFDSWAFDYEWQNIPTTAVFPAISNYVTTDTLSNVISSYACSDKVITVGNYFNTDRHIKYDSTIHISVNDYPDQLAANSSRGPSRTGLVKPDITATGHHIVSCVVLSSVPGLITAADYRLAIGGMHMAGGGTSAAAPVVAGIAALYLEACPTASYLDFKNALTTSAKHDMHTYVPYPNNAWGYGKADGFATMLSSCLFLGLDEKENLDFSVYPNPASDKLNISYKYNQATNYSISNVFGETVLAGTFIQSENIISVQQFPAGFYFIRIIAEGNESIQIFSVVR